MAETKTVISHGGWVKWETEIKVLKRSREARQLELFCSAGWCDGEGAWTLYHLFT